MKHKVRLKRAIILSFIAFFILEFVFIIINYMQYRKYTLIFNEKIDAIATNIKEKYPEVTFYEIAKILNDYETNGLNTLKELGIDVTKDSYILKNDNYFKIFLILDIVIFALLFIIVIIIFLKYNYSKDKKLKEITKYIEEINRRNYKLDIEDNTEDELSILKNEIYKTTVMLKETSENSKQDKIKLKDALSDISHQLKTPLTSITIMLDNMLDNKNMEQETRAEFIRDIKREITNINFLVASLLKLSKFDANTIKFINKDEYIEKILKESVKNVEGLCDLKNIEINIVGNEEEKINCDLKWQIEAITNILKNCVEHSDENSKIDIRYEKNKIYTKIEIRDYGIGIDNKDLPHIFERFYKGKNSANDSIGIGLALAKSIIEESNGYIYVESEIGKGTVFVIKYL